VLQNSVAFDQGDTSFDSGHGVCLQRMLVSVDPCAKIQETSKLIGIGTGTYKSLDGKSLESGCTMLVSVHSLRSHPSQWVLGTVRSISSSSPSEGQTHT
jgi:hypothetical protein